MALALTAHHLHEEAGLAKHARTQMHNVWTSAPRPSGPDLHYTTTLCNLRPYHTGRLCRQFLRLIAKTSDKLVVGKTFL